MGRKIGAALESLGAALESLRQREQNENECESGELAEVLDANLHAALLQLNFLITFGEVIKFKTIPTTTNNIPMNSINTWVS